MMAKITVEVDTVTRTLSVMLNGEAIEDVKCVTCYSVDAEDEAEYGKQMMCRINKASEEEEVEEGGSGIKRYEQIYAGEEKFSPKKDEVLSATAKDLSAFFKQNLTKLR